MIQRTLVFVFLLFAVLAVSAYAIDTGPDWPSLLSDADVRVGFGGHYKVGVWTPVEISLGRGATGNGERLIVTVPDGDGVPSRVSMRIPDTREPVSVWLYVRFGRIGSKMNIRCQEDSVVVAERIFQPPPAAGAGRPMIVTVGADSLGANRIVESLRQEAEDQIVVAGLKDCCQLPAKWYGYEGVDALMISAGPGTGKLSEAQAAALEEWIAMGGRLVLCVGSEAEEVLREDSLLGQFAPGRLDSMVSLRQTGELETYADSSIPIFQPEDRRRGSVLDVPRLTGIEGTIEAREVDLPLVVRTPRAFGQIVFLAADLDGALLAKWGDRGRLAARLLDLPTERTDESHDTAAAMHFGFDDMAGQLRSALDRFEGVRRVPFWWVAVLIVVYLLMIGPVDYFFLRHLTRRMQWTWITFPAIVVAFCVMACVLAFRLKGDETRIHQAVLVDVDTASGRLRGTSWANVFSPRTDGFNLSLRPEFAGREDPRQPGPLVSWLGLPGRGIGAMNPRASNPISRSDHYDFSPDLETMEGMPILVWSTKSLTARWTALDAKCPKAELEGDGYLLTGRVENRFDFPLKNCILAYQRWAYVLETLEPAGSVRIDSMTKRSELRTLLTGRKIVFTEKRDHYHQESTPYDRASIDPAYVLRAMMFYSAAGGEQYTRLSNGYQNFVDFSDLLKTGRAVLVAEAPPECPGATWMCDGKPFDSEECKRVTVLRFVFPVEQTEE